jgi:hypothetical protein
MYDLKGKNREKEVTLLQNSECRFQNAEFIVTVVTIVVVDTVF